jgi:hypothetical protein
MLAEWANFLVIFVRPRHSGNVTVSRYIMPRFGRLFRSDCKGDLGHLSGQGQDDNAIKE